MVCNIFETYKNQMFGIAYSILNNTHDAEDVLIDNMIKICKNIDKFMGISKNDIKVLLYTYTKNAAINYYNAKKNKQTVGLDEVYNYFSDEDDNDESFDNLSTHDDFVIHNEMFGDLQNHINKLSDKYKDIIILKYVEMYNNREIAKILDIPESTVSTRLNRALKKLQNMYEQSKD